MRGLSAVCSTILIVLIFVCPAKGDLFSSASRVNSTMFYSAGGYIYKNPPQSSATSTIVNLGYKLGTAGSCGSFNLGASLKGIFNLDAAQQFLKNLGANAISSAPMLLMAYASPTLANTFMHIKDSAERILAVRNQQCEDVQKVAMQAGILMRAREEGKYRCMMEEQKEGATLNQAIQHCLSSSDALAKYIPLDAASNTDQTREVNLASDIKKLTGMDNEEYKLFREAIGDITLNGNSILDEERKDPVKRIYDQNVQHYNDVLTNLVNEIGFSNTIDSAELQKISNETGVTILPSTLVQLYDMKETDPYAYSIYMNMLANKLALYKMNEEILNIESDLEIAKEKARNQGNNDLAELLDKKSKLDLERQRILERERAAESTSALLLQIHYQRLRESARNVVNGTRNANRSYINSQLYNSTLPRVLPRVSPGSKAVLKRYMP